MIWDVAVLAGSVLVAKNSLGDLMYIVLIGCGICYIGSLLTSPPRKN